MFNPLTWFKKTVAKKVTDATMEQFEGPIEEWVLEQKRSPLKGWRTVLINGGILAAAAFLHFLAGINLQDLGLDATTATIVMAIINGLLRAITTTPIGKGEVVLVKKPISSSDRVKYLSIIVLALGLTAVAAIPAQAQQYTIGIGAGFYASSTPHLAGEFTLLVPLTDKTQSFTTFEARPILGETAYTTLTGIERQLVTDEGKHLTLSTHLQAGFSKADATSGAFAGGGSITWSPPLFKGAALTVIGEDAINPATSTSDPQVRVEARYKF